MPSPFVPQWSSTPFATLALAASLSAVALLAGCDATAGKTRALDRELAAVIADYRAVTASHVAAADAKNVAYNAETLRGPNWSDLSIEASHQDQYAGLAKRLRAIADNPDGTPVQKAVAESLLADINAHGARFKVRCADIAHGVLGARLVGLHGAIGQIEAMAVVRANNSRQVQAIIPLIEKGQAGQSMGLDELVQAEAQAVAKVKEAEDKLAATTASKEAARAKADELFAKASDLQLSVRRTQGLDRFDVMDQASTTLCEAEKAEAAFSGVDQDLVALKRNLSLCTTEQKTLADTIAGFKERLAAAKEILKNTDSDAAAADQEMNKVHAAWVAEAKVLDGQETEKVDARFVEALALAEQAEQTLGKAVAAAGSQPNLLPAKGITKAGLATDIARYQMRRLQALESHRNALDSLAKREAVWLPNAADPFFAKRAEELAKTEMALAKTALAACSEASTQVEEATQGGGSDALKAALGGVQASIGGYRKAIGEIRQALGDDSPVAAPEPAPKPAASEAPTAEKPASAEPEAE